MTKHWHHWCITFGFIVAVCCTAILSGCAVMVWKLALSVDHQCQHQESKSVVQEI